MTALEDVAVERTRQKLVEGWSESHDDEHVNGDLALAASCYVTLAALEERARARAKTLATTAPSQDAPPAWPWDVSWWKPKGTRRNLVRAGALIVAEIERLDRAEAATLPASTSTDVGA